MYQQLINNDSPKTGYVFGKGFDKVTAPSENMVAENSPRERKCSRRPQLSHPGISREMNGNIRFLSQRTRHISIQHPIPVTSNARKSLRTCPDVNVTDYGNDVVQWNLDEMLKNDMKEERKGERKQSETRRKSECAFTSRETKDFVFPFPSSFTRRDREVFLKNRFDRRNAVCIYDREGFFNFLEMYISRKHMITFGIQ